MPDLPSWRPQQRFVQSVSGLDRFERVALYGVAFSLGAFNSRPVTLSSGFVCLVAAVALLTHQRVKRGRTMQDPGSWLLIAYVWAAWVAVATMSTVANFELDTALNLLWGYWVPFVLYLSFVELDVRTDDFQWILASFAAGLALRFGYAALVFYSTVGLPPLGELLLVRYNVVGMQPYIEATFGNTSNSAALLTPAFVALALSLVLTPMRRQIQILVAVTLAILFFNLLITGSRSAIIISTAMLTVSAFKARTRWRYVLLALVAVFIYVFTARVGDDFVGQLMAVLTADIRGDNSLAERQESMKYGLGMMLDYPLGVGPGMQGLYNPYFAAHQFAISQGSELGFLGMIVVTIFAGVVVMKVVTLSPTGRPGESTVGIPLLFGALCWFVFAMTANMLVAQGPAMPWSGMLAMFLALSAVADRNARSFAHSRTGR